MSNFQVRGCCCGIPFGCGVLLVVLVSAFLLGLAVPGSFWHAAGKGVALIVMPGLVLALVAGAGVRRG